MSDAQYLSAADATASRRGRAIRKRADMRDRDMLLEDKLRQKGTVAHCPVVILTQNERILTGNRHYTKATWKDISVWTLPGGRSSEGETLEETLRREVAEEVGIRDFSITDFIGEVPGAKEGDIVPLFFGSTDEEARLMEPEKFSEWRWVPFTEYIQNSQYAGFNPPARTCIIEFLKKQMTRRSSGAIA